MGDLHRGECTGKRVCTCAQLLYFLPVAMWLKVYTVVYNCDTECFYIGMIGNHNLYSRSLWLGKMLIQMYNACFSRCLLT